MDSRKILMLGVVAVLLLLLALWYGGQRQADSGDAARAELFPGLAEKANEVDGIRLTGPGEELLWDIRRQGESWAMASRGDHPADFARVRELLLKLAQAKKIESKTANPSLYSRLGVQDMDEADAEGLLVELSGLTPPLALIVGRATPTADANYVRRAGEGQSWLVDTALPIQKEAAQWLLRDLTEIPVARVQRVEIVHAGGNRVELVRNDEPGSDFKVGNLPRGREQGFSYMADAAGAFLSDLRFDDVMPAADLPAPEDEAEITRARFDMEDGLVYRITSWRDEEKTFIQMEVELDEARAATAIAAEQAVLREAFETQQASAGEGDAAGAGEEIAPAAPAAVIDPEADAAVRLTELRDEARAANARFAGWSYTLPSQKASNLNRKLEAYLKAED